MPVRLLDVSYVYRKEHSEDTVRSALVEISYSACASACPQAIDVPRELAEIHSKLPIIDLVPHRGGE